MQPDLLDAAQDLVGTLLAGSAGRRVIVGITGAPGAGKSTLAEALAACFEPDAVAVPMDGFHLSNVELKRLGLSNRKGALPTFDGDGFVHLLERIHAADGLVYAPAYSRVVHESIGGVIPVFASTRLVVVEGNYLLVPEQPWLRGRALLDLAIYLDVPDHVRVPLLLERQRSFGLDDEAARDWVERSDEANARLIATTRPYADVVLTRTT
jgi:pantothenate kinase